MTGPVDPVTDADLDAYVDDQLEVARRIEVEAYLAGNPQVAARVMSDLRTRDELRLALVARPGTASPATGEAARRLARGLARERMFRRFHQAAAMIVLVGAGWLAHWVAGSVTAVVASTPPPAYVEDAMQAHGASMVRAGMASQIETPAYDAAEIRAATAIVMPALPADWSVRDVQVYPSRFGPSVDVEFDAEELGMVSLFAVRPGTFDVVIPTPAPGAATSSVYFQIGEVAYVLAGSGDIDALDRAAQRLADTLY